jgi:SNF2 family DNA or RNA helicase
MNIVHGTWIPQSEPEFLQTGTFYLWVETTQRGKTRKPVEPTNRYPGQLGGTALVEWLSQTCGLAFPPSRQPGSPVSQQFFVLPSQDAEPLPSPELSRYLETDLPEQFQWQTWSIDCLPVLTTVKASGSRMATVNAVVKVLNDLHFVALSFPQEVQLGADLLFWYHCSQAVKRLIFKDQYIPALKYRELPTPQPPASATKSKAKSSRKKSSEPPASPPAPNFEIYYGWEFIGPEYETILAQYLDYMPLACAAGFAEALESPQFHDRETLLRHFSECLLTDIVSHTYTTQAFEKLIDRSILSTCLKHSEEKLYGIPAQALPLYQQWKTWRDRIARRHAGSPFSLCFQLQEPSKAEEAWQIQFQVASKQDPSSRISLLDFWRLRPTQPQELKAKFGEDFERHLLLNLGHAARIYPRLWQGLETDQPAGIPLDLDAAFEFLKQDAWVLEAAGYKVIVPAWWTPEGRRRAKIRLKAKGKLLTGGEDKAKSYFGFESLVQYQYELSLGGEPLSEQEWTQLVNAKSPLVQFRGQWVELDQQKMQQLLEFWKTHQQESPELSLQDFLKLSAQEEDSLEVVVDRDEMLAEMLAHLHHKTQLPVAEAPQSLQAQLREYQKRGLSWLQYLEQLGLNGCLADDMGLGKTLEMIARLVQEQEWAEQVGQTPLPPTLVIAPTSVVGNWQRELQKFAPQMRVLVHHGSQRTKEDQTFEQRCRQHHIVITSFALARKDAKLLSGLTWQRIVLDEAQNIKNPKAGLTKAILKLPAKHRWALTGTPVENRLLDLWSIFNFLSPGYLGNQTQFRRAFELPIQKNNDPRQAATLKKLVEPFILRRVKTDQSIIKDLPDKVEQKLYCNLTQEQASLYEAVVKDVENKINSVEGIQRKGLILATLTKLKQICDHPRQFLQDNSDFTPERSHKLSRLSEMVQEAIDEGESLLIFTQFTELGEAIEAYLRHSCHLNTYYLHGGTAQKRRDEMIQAFQDPETDPSVFVLSLKAGGVGITLTKANHVFHFDRWWNPAVEDQATDRAFRIGQKKNVFVHKFIAMGTLEERIDEMIEDKKKLAGVIVGSDESWLTELDNDSFRRLIALNQSAILE